MFVSAVGATLAVKDAIQFYWLGQMIVFFHDWGKEKSFSVLTQFDVASEVYMRKTLVAPTENYDH